MFSKKDKWHFKVCVCKFTDSDKKRIALEEKLFVLSEEYGSDSYKVAHKTPDGVNAQTSWKASKTRL